MCAVDQTAVCLHVHTVDCHTSRTRLWLIKRSMLEGRTEPPRFQFAGRVNGSVDRLLLDVQRLGIIAAKLLPKVNPSSGCRSHSLGLCRMIPSSSVMEHAPAKDLRSESFGVSYVPSRRCACAKAVLAGFDLARSFLCCQLLVATLVTPLRAHSLQHTTL